MIKKINAAKAKAQFSSAKPQGVLALLGSWREIEDTDLDALIAAIYNQREKDLGRPAELER